MHHGVCTLAPARAILAPFLPSLPLTTLPDPDLASRFCLCGARMDMEMERDLGLCVDCQAEAAGVSHGGMA